MTTQTPVTLSAISYVIIYVKDTQKAISFYHDTLGLKVKISEEGWTELETGTTTLALHKDDKHGQTSHSGNGAVIVFNVDDIYAAYESLKNKGVKFDKEPHTVCEEGDYVGKSADFADPDGNRLSIYGKVSAAK